MIKQIVFAMIVTAGLLTVAACSSSPPQTNQLTMVERYQQEVASGDHHPYGHDAPQRPKMILP